jgi:hypothetical protein
MRFLMLVLLWCLLFAVAWPLALLALVAIPILWLLSIPFQILGVVVAAAVAFVKAVLFLPARILGYRG